MHNMKQADRVRFNLVTGSQPPQPQPGTLVTVQQLSGTWTFQFEGAPATLTVTSNGSFEYAIDNFSTTGSVSANGSQVTLTDRNGNRWSITVQQVQSNTIRFVELTWTRRQSVDPTPGTLNIQGNWTEVRTDGRPAKAISVSGNNYSEISRNGVFTGTIRLTNDRLVIQGNDGSVETFRVVADQDNRLNFADVQTGQPIRRFHWVRS